MKTTPRDASLSTAASGDDEMPILFMDGLPPNFQQSAQLAAIASFMADSEDEAAESAGNRPRDDPLSRRKSGRVKRRREPYARKPVAVTKEGNANKEKKTATTTNDTKELQLFLSMFHVS
ncbi:Echinoderm microtubule-associated protein-like 1 [Phytophthora boehmeriae]|uniref:Echinoderm microtubule-associated protein-like 1 n=1 Tax=Phytophthora boehmeriae TaxID=109152 RepID=A0A8T1WVB6_9STRA|nr:Echinoderm microtubule-associated protein-like 1 [Phytophthora boehmeriae]